jgi:Flp pilus assembly pilin Flp
MRHLLGQIFFNKKGQSIVEYCILFAVVVGVIIIAATGAIRPALNSLYQRTASSLAQINTQVP